ncbi:MAG: hypothetical protein NTW16_02350 [Bacteroidetes bacterium]|nr:hypothetical protein [Bacteroidota bacterium]
MKHILIYIFLAISLHLHSQVAISIDSSGPDNSAMLDVKSTDKGLLIPRLSTAERNAIVSPSNSLMIFNTSTRCFEAYNEITSVWETFHCFECPLPQSAGAITGTSILCDNQAGVSYSVDAVTGANGYAWAYSGTGLTISSGDNTQSITADFSMATSGNLTVYGTNACGNGSVSANFAITVNAEIPASPTAGSNTLSQNSITWNWNPTNGASGYKWSTSNNYNNAFDNGTNTSYAQVFLLCNTAYTFYVWAYNACGHSTDPLILTGITYTCCGTSITKTHLSLNGTGAPVNKTVTYGTVETDLSGTSKCWITQNLGAAQQASDATDPWEASAGWYWQFNRKQGYKHDINFRTPNTPWNNNIIEFSDWQPANDPCRLLLSSEWRLPTSEEWSVTHTGWITYYDAYATVLKLHAAGYLAFEDGSLSQRGSSGYYWSSSQGSDNWGLLLQILNYTNGVTYGEKSLGFPVRCLRDI